MSCSSLLSMYGALSTVRTCNLRAIPLSLPNDGYVLEQKSSLAVLRPS